MGSLGGSRGFIAKLRLEVDFEINFNSRLEIMCGDYLAFGGISTVSIT